MREFNSTGLCVPRKHYMVDISGRVAQIQAMIDRGDYFCINRARQYGKTTTIAALRRALAHEYAVVSLDFQELSHADFETEGSFVCAFAQTLVDAEDLGRIELPESAHAMLDVLLVRDPRKLVLRDLFRVFRRWLKKSDKPMVLIIDEVDSATNNQVFIDFLAWLRLQYLEREDDSSYPAFHSVVLVGVTDVRYLKSKVRPGDVAKVNSPWNIATDFRVDMSFSVGDVAGMLEDYEADHATGMNISTVAAEIVAWTGGYPFLVSRLCQLVDERGLSWDCSGVNAAVRLLLKNDDVSLFESLTAKLLAYPKLKEQLRTMLMRGVDVDFSAYDETQKLLRMYGFVAERENRVVIANRVFETLLYDYFLAEEQGSTMRGAAMEARSLFVRDGSLNMRAVLEGFRRAYMEIYGPLEVGGRFMEKDGRELFLLYLKPIISGTGNYYVEAQTRDQTRTDVIVDYAGERFVVELKIWRGPRYNEEGELQVVGYLEHFGLDVGYMLSFNFNKHKESGLVRVAVGNKTLWEETI